MIEVLVVIGIIGLMAAIAVVQINKAWQRSRLDSAAINIASALQSAYTFMVNNRAPVFVLLVQNSGTSALEIRITQNSDGSGREFSRVEVPDFVSLTTGPNWPASPASGVWYLGCDTMGRTFNPATGAAVTAPQALVFTHASMVSGALTPRITYTVQVFPIWQVITTKSVS